MRVLHVVPYFHQAWAYGGIPRLSFHLCSALAKQGIEVDAVTTDALDRERRRDELDFKIEGVSVRAYKNISNRLAYDLQLFLPLGLGKEKKRLTDYDLVHIHGHRNLLNTRMSAWADQAGIPVILQPNGTLVNIERRQGLKSIYDLIFGNRQVKNTSLFIAVSEAEKKQFLALGLAEDKIFVAPNGVFVENPDPAVNFKERFGVKGDYILYLGKLTPRKGIEYVIEALKFLPDKNIRAVIAGNDMGMMPALKALTQKNGLSDRVVFTGLLTTPWKEAAYREALVTVYAGEYEIFGLVQFESILCGTPAIVADDCGAGEWVKKSGGGYLVPYANAEAIARVIKTLDPEKEKAKLGAAKEWIQKYLSWDAVAVRIREIYGRVLKDRER
jgi:glycosyltransferase involved in cell wall biosynthesis